MADTVFINLQTIRIDTISPRNALYSEEAFFSLKNYRLSTPDNLNNLKINHLSGAVHDSTLVMHHIFYQQKDSIKEKLKDELKIRVDDINFRSVDYGSLFKDQKIFVRAMILRKPDVNLISSEDPVKKYTVRSDEESSILDEIVPYLSGSFRIDTLTAENGKIDYTIRNNKKLILQKAKDIDLLFTRVLVDTLKTGSKVFAEDIHLDLKDYQLIKDTTSELRIARFRAYLSDSLFNFRDINFKSSENGLYHIEAGSIIGKGVDFRTAFEKRKARADSVIINNPVIKAFSVNEKDSSSLNQKDQRGKSMQEIFYDLLGSFSDASIRIRKFYVNDGEIDYKLKTKEHVVEQKASRVNIIIDSIRIDSSRENINQFYERFFVKLKNYEVKVHEDNFKVNISGVCASSEKKYVKMNDIVITQIRSFGETQRTYFINTIGSAVASCFDFESFISQQKVYSSQIEIDSMDLSIFLDAGKPERPDYITKMPNDLVRDLPFYLRLDTVYFENSRISYINDDPLTPEVAKLDFDHIKAMVVNFTNDSLRMSDQNPAKLESHSTLMGEAMLKFYVRINLLDEKLNAQYGGHLGNMKAQTFNDFLNLIGIKVEKGHLDTSIFHVNIVDGKAEGELLLLYDDLKIKVIDPQTQQVSRVKSFIGNFIVKDSNPKKKSRKPEITELSFELQVEDGFFYFLWRVLREGVVDTVTKSTLFNIFSKQ